MFTNKDQLGIKAAEFYAALFNQPVQVSVVTGKVFQGVLVGVDQYDIILRQESGLQLLLAKGNVVYVHRAL